LFERLLIDLSIWIPPSFCKKLPIILPYVVRDPSCRVKRETGEDEWGSANEHGFLRDDNTLIKGLVRSFDIRSPTVRSYDGFRLGRGFVASHIWRNVRIKGTHMISSRHHKLNSFVPNLAWLPIQISKLTDREGSLPQRLLQAISHKIYREISLPREILNLWEYLPFPEEFHDFFSVSDFSVQPFHLVVVHVTFQLDVSNMLGSQIPKSKTLSCTHHGRLEAHQ